MNQIDERLEGIIKFVMNDQTGFAAFSRLATGALACLGVPYDQATISIQQLACTVNSVSGLYKIEHQAHKQMKDLGIYNALEREMEKRALKILEIIKPYLLPGESVLDLGCGSGEIATLLQKDGFMVSCADAIDWRISAQNLDFYPVVKNIICNPNTTKPINKKFEQAVVLTVWHHTNNVDALVKEVFRVAERIIIIESLANTPAQFLPAAGIDWLYNRIFHYNEDPKQKINVPLNFESSVGWQNKIFKLVQRKPLESIDLGYCMEISPEHHHVFVY